MSKTTVLYKDVAPGADENAQVSASGNSDDSNLDLIPFENSIGPVATLESNRWLLDGTFVFRDTQNLAFWSTELSGEDGLFASPPTITIDFTKQYSSVGLTLVFDTATDEYCDQVNVKWYQGGVLKSDKDFYPDSSTYFCQNTVTSYDQIVITLVKTSLPTRRAKINQIVFGIYRSFGMAEIRSASVINEMDGIAETLPISTFNWTLDSREDVDFMFQLKQPVEISNNSNLLGVYYIDGHKRKSARIYDIECYDAVGVLDETTFSGGVYTKKSAKSILEEIIGSDFEIEYADDVIDTELTGIIAPDTKRTASQQVLFAWGVCMATDRSSKLKVFNLDSTLSEIEDTRTFSGVSNTVSAIITEVQVYAHSFTENANGGIEIAGTKYSDTKTLYTVKNPDVTANDKQNVHKIENATLVSSDNAQSIAQRVYDWCQRRNGTEARIVWNGEALGDFVSFPNSWGKRSSGNIMKMEIKLSNTVVSKCEALGQGG